MLKARHVTTLVSYLTPISHISQVLLRKPPPSVSASFFQKVQFLIEGEKSVQSYSKKEYYDDQ